MKIKFCFITLILLCSLNLFSQNDHNKWALTVGAGAALYSLENGAIVGGQLIRQLPRISVSRYMFKNVTFAASFSTDYIDKQKYVTYDTDARYDFGTSENKFLSIYVLLGASFINSFILTSSNPNSSNFGSDGSIMLPTVNFGAGGTLWISDKFGLNGQLMYKFNEVRFKSQRSHIFISAGLVYRFSDISFGDGTLSARSKKPKKTERKRLWDVKN